MFPLDPATFPLDPATQAMARGGTFVRPGAIAWGESPTPREEGAPYGQDAPPYGQGAPYPAPGGADAGRDAVEKTLAAMAGEAMPGQAMAGDGLLDELARARVWVPLPGGPHPVTDGCAVTLPVVTYLGAEFVPCFTSAERLAGYAGRRLRRAADAHRIPHIVVPAVELARRLCAQAPGLGMALNPGAETSAPIYPEGVAYLSGEKDLSGKGIRVGHPPAEPTELLREVGRCLRRVTAVAAASRAWLSVPGSGEGLVLSVALDDPADADAHAAVITAIERAVASAPRQPGHPVDVTFPGEAAPDILDDWIAAHADPFYVRAVTPR